MKTTTLILTLTVAAILGVGCVSRVTGQKQKPAPQQVVVYYGDVPVSLTADSFQVSFDVVALAR